MTETIRYEESGGVGEVEFRKYPSIILATVTGTNENENFWILFRYITGNNHSGKKLPMTSPVITPEKIAMTTPVISETNAMSFVLPASYSMKEVPEPIDTRIRIQEIPSRELAVIRFSGRASASDVAQVRERLLKKLEESNIMVVGTPFLMRYNAPYTPGFMRRNEVGVEITR
ncbi:MAG: heme-binding protein [Methanoregulaceae archaeon]|jgi:effector-binding domain-containing protein|nr:heme-binding protein [Methanoregulaceae archaeon]